VFEQYVPKRKTFVRLAKAYETESSLNALLEELSARANKQREVLLNLFMLQAQTKKPIAPKKLLKKSDASDGVLRALLDKGVVERYEVQEDRNIFDGETIAISELSEAQEEAYKVVRQSFNEKEVGWLKGFTSREKKGWYIN